MKYQSYIEELQNTNSLLEISDILQWMNKYVYEFNDAILQSDCGKWSKWLKDKTIHLYPCVCPIRNEDCIFIETYYKLSKVLEVYKKEEKCKNELNTYQQIKHNKPAVFEWIKANEKFLNEILFFDHKIKIRANKDMHNILKLNSKDFEATLKLQEVFTEIYFLEEYRNY